MFEQLKIKIAVRQSIIWGIVLIVALFFVFMFNLTVMYRQVDSKLTELANVPIYQYVEEEETSYALEKPRNTMTVFINHEGKYYITDTNMFEQNTLTKIISKIMSGDKHSGYLRVNDKKIAFKCQQNIIGMAIYICDYTEDYSNMLRLMSIIIIAGAIGIFIIGVISVSWSKRNVAPVEDAFEKQQALVANASHELKTPITIINTDLSILKDTTDNFTEEQKKWLDNIGFQVNRMGKLVMEMLELARLESSEKNQIKADVNLSTVAECVVLESEALAFEKKISFITDIKKDVIINAVEANIEKLLYILIENALKYTSQGGTVTVKVGTDRKRGVLRVRNSGIGIKKEDIPKLFDRFYRMDEAHTAQDGFGLGLSIAKSIVDLNGGKIGVESKEGEYTEFIVMFKTV